MKKHLLSIIASIVICAALLIGCGGGGGGGGGGSTPQTTTNIKVSIDGSIFPNTSMRATKDNKIASLTLKTSSYSKGKLQKGNIPDRFATKSGSNYVCNVQGLVNGLDYRFSAFHNGKKLMENQISASELQKDAEIPVDIDTSLKTLAYDSWNARNPSNASVDNFMKKGEIISSSKTDTTANATWRAPYLNSNTQTTISCIVKDPYGESSSYDFNIEIIPAP